MSEPATLLAPQPVTRYGIDGHYHRNPDGSVGGFVANTATVSPTATIGPTAEVFGTAKVSGNANVFGSSVGHIQSPIGHAYQPSYTPYGLNPFASQADSFGMLRNSPYAGAMNAQAMGLGSYRPSQSQWFSHYPIYDDIQTRMYNRSVGRGGLNAGTINTFDGGGVPRAESKSLQRNVDVYG